ncbi:MAG: hypothetical protein RI924_659 [Bacteroidota bacterium]|jgi:drug/metabolite transporter (DMT)-like permease
MIYVLLSVCCSVLVSILLKLARRYEVNVIQAIGFNYLMAALLCFYFFKPEIPAFTQELPYSIYISLGFLLPSIFVVLAKSVKYTGIVRTDIAQRLSLLIPLLAAYLIFGEAYSGIKTAAILLGLIAVICAIPWDVNQGQSSKSWLFPLFVFFGFGLIDVLFKQLASITSIPFTSSLLIIFLLALGISAMGLSYLILLKKMSLTLKNIGCGLILGFFNFGNIYFYLKAHQALNTQPSVVFTTMNIGVIVLGSFVGLLIFKEKLTKLNFAGIGLALLSIFILALF